MIDNETSDMYKKDKDKELQFRSKYEETFTPSSDGSVNSMDKKLSVIM